MASKEPLFQAKPATLWNRAELQPPVFKKKKEKRKKAYIFLHIFTKGMS